MQYSICIRKEPGTCGIHWAVTSTTEYTEAWQLDDAPAAAVIGSAASALDAYIAIPGSAAVSYSGDVFSGFVDATSDSALIATGHRYIMQVFSMNAATLDGDGFDMTWSQVPCNNARADDGHTA